jgi:hypothetical protein
MDTSPPQSAIQVCVRVSAGPCQEQLQRGQELLQAWDSLHVRRAASAQREAASRRTIVEGYPP